MIVLHCGTVSFAPYVKLKEFLIVSFPQRLKTKEAALNVASPCSWLMLTCQGVTSEDGEGLTCALGRTLRHSCKIRKIP